MKSKLDKDNTRIQMKYALNNWCYVTCFVCFDFFVWIFVEGHKDMRNTLWPIDVVMSLAKRGKIIWVLAVQLLCVILNFFFLNSTQTLLMINYFVSFFNEQNFVIWKYIYTFKKLKQLRTYKSNHQNSHL